MNRRPRKRPEKGATRPCRWQDRGDRRTGGRAQRGVPATDHPLLRSRQTPGIPDGATGTGNPLGTRDSGCTTREPSGDPRDPPGTPDPAAPPGPPLGAAPLRHLAAESGTAPGFSGFGAHPGQGKHRGWVRVWARVWVFLRPHNQAVPSPRRRPEARAVSGVPPSRRAVEGAAGLPPPGASAPSRRMSRAEPPPFPARLRGRLGKRPRRAPRGDGPGSPSASPAAVNNRNKPRASPFPFPTLPEEQERSKRCLRLRTGSVSK